MLDNLGFNRRFVIDESLCKAKDELICIAEMCNDAMDDAPKEEVEKLRRAVFDAMAKIITIKKEIGFDYFKETD